LLDAYLIDAMGIGKGCYLCGLVYRLILLLLLLCYSMDQVRFAVLAVIIDFEPKISFNSNGLLQKVFLTNVQKKSI
jgi:hypothetical protein